MKKVDSKLTPHSTLPLDVLRCVQSDESDAASEICRGALRTTEDGLTCEHCGFRYRQVRGVPVLKFDDAEAQNWFEQMYSNRSRTVELASDWLGEERKFIKDFVAARGVTGRCVEIGCGVGLFAETVPNFIGFEFALDALLVEGFEGFTRVCGDARRLPFADESMELVFSFVTLEHVPEVHQAFAEIARVVARGGFIVIKPAWHCTRYNTELIPVLPYNQLTLRQRITKAMLPVLSTRAYKLLTKLPWRLWRRATQANNRELSWRRLTPYHGELWISDADAVASLDSYEAIRFFEAHGCKCLSHAGAMKQLLAGHDLEVFQKQ